MTEQEKLKLAQIIAKRLCPNGKSHFNLYGNDANCYSRENFAECQVIADTVDAIVEAGLKFDVTYSLTAAFDSVQAERERDLERRLAAAEHRAEVAEAELSRYTEMIARDNIYRRAERAESDKNTYCRALYNLSLKYVVADNISTIIDDDGNEYRAGQEVCALSIMAREVKQAEKELEGKK